MTPLRRPSRLAALGLLVLAAPLSLGHGPEDPLDLSVEGIRKWLARLKSGPQPVQGPEDMACCYAPTRVPKVHDVRVTTCRSCTLRSIHFVEGPDPRGRLFFDQELPALRKGALAVRGVKVSLDERFLCIWCRPNSRRPRVDLILTWPDGTQVRTPRVRSRDLRALADLMRGVAGLWSGPEEVPRDRLDDRLRQMLGLEEETP